MIDKLRLRLETRTTAHLIWTETEDGWECGPILVMPWKREGGAWVWAVFVNGNKVGRAHGYLNERDAKNAAPHCREVRALMEGKAGETAVAAEARAAL